MENKLDNFFKNKLDEREIEFNEAHWSQAQFMLDQQDELERQQAWWKYWILGLLCLVVLGGVGYFMFGNQSETSSKMVANESMKVEESQPLEMEVEQTNKEVNQETSTQQENQTVKENFATTETTTENQAARNSNSHEITEKTIQHENNPATITENKVTMYAGNGLSAKNETRSSSILSEKDISLDAKAAEKNKKDDLFMKSDKEVAADASEIDMNSSEKVAVHLDHVNTQKPLVNQASSDLTNPEILLSEMDSTIDYQNITSNENGVQASPHSNTSSIQNDKNELGNIDFLSPSYTLLTFPAKTLGEAVPEIETRKIEPTKERGLRLGLTASALLYPFSNTSELQFSQFPDINPLVTAQHFNGFKIGLTAQYDLNYRWALGAELLYYQQIGTFQSVRSSRQVNYRFGAEVTTFDLVPQSLHYLEIPLLVVRKWNKHAIELGMASDFLMGVKNVIGTYETTTNNEPVLQARNNSWKYQDGFAKLHFRGLLGYKYQVFRRLELGVRMNRTLGGGILATNYTTLNASRFILLESRPINIELKMAYKF